MEKRPNGKALYRAGTKAFRNYTPVTYSAKDGSYRSFRYGKHLELFILDERSFRSAKAGDKGACDNPPKSGSVDLAPTGPQKIRSFFAAFASSLKKPAPSACLKKINDPTRTMLGKHQYEKFTQALAASNATWKVIINSVAIQQYYAYPYDRWEGFAAEREKLIKFIQANAKYCFSWPPTSTQT